MVLADGMASKEPDRALTVAPASTLLLFGRLDAVTDTWYFVQITDKSRLHSLLNGSSGNVEVYACVCVHHLHTCTMTYGAQVI